MRLFLAAALLLALTGCKSKSPASQSSVPVEPASGFSASGPKVIGYLDFEVDFVRPLSGGRVLRIFSESRPWLVGDVTFVDSMQQKPGGEWIDFDCDHIADRIIDKALVAEITPLCSQGHSMALDYWKQQGYTPDTFTDSEGNTWIRAK